MKIGMITLLRLICFALLWTFCPCLSAYAQEAKLQIESFSKLEAKAAETVDVSLDERMLRLAAKLLSDKRSPDEAKVKELVAGLKGVYVKVFEFDKEGEYSDAEIEPVRAQLRGPGWTRIVGVRTRRGGENVEVYIMGDVDKVQGLAIIATDPRELVVVNLVGPIDLEKLSELEGNFGIPHLDLKFPERKPRKDKRQ